MSDVWLPRGKAPYAPEPKPITDAQWSYLQSLLDDASAATVYRWIEFANGYVCNARPVGGFTRIHAIRAISMIKSGASDEFNGAYLEALSFGQDVQPDDFPPPQRPLWLRRKIAQSRTRREQTALANFPTTDSPEF